MANKDGTNAQRGFTLLEVLVAVLVLSVGLLGIAGLQLKALQGAHLGYQRSVASLAAQDVQERLWFELAQRIDTDDEALCPQDNLTELTNVDSSWHTQWSDLLPELEEAAIQHESSLGCAFEITIDWQDDRFSEEGDVSELSYHFRLPVTAEEET